MVLVKVVTNYREYLIVITGIYNITVKDRYTVTSNMIDFIIQGLPHNTEKNMIFIFK